MKKKVIAVTLLAAMALTGCGSKGFTGEKVGEIEDSKGNVTMATVQFENGKAVAVDIDVKQADGSMKSEASKSGAYDMKNEPGKKWHEQADLLEEFIVANDFDLSKVTLTNDEGNTDAVSGVTIKVKGYLDAVEDALKQAK
ncbi:MULTISPECIES: FMN-binding protein [Clostridium]|uniref:FMN-binding domain-containing protein n=1 Tax=Clostridium disporicum TaxID=84024 RepID=A0A174IUT7_9CLOT|nr:MULTISPECIES: FMN-binding protein [Clostridium]MCD2501870.1 FMN-binding protein [Clostridium sp. NSJ-145]CUO89108.1 FMN-binding domain-containing protein [Clostridium disporicum]